MKFWDSSAVTPLLVEETDSEIREQQLQEDVEMLVWYGTVAEVESAISRRKREGSVSTDDEQKIRQKLGLLEQAWHEIQPTLAVRNRAIRLLRVHQLRAADAFQLAAALAACGEQPFGFGFYTNDVRLAQAAAAEGFVVS